MSEQPNQSLTQAIWKASDVLRGIGDVSLYKDHVLALVLLKYLSDQWDDLPLSSEGHQDDIQLRLPSEAKYNLLLQECETPGNGRRIDGALRAIADANPLFKGVFETIHFDSGLLGDNRRRDQSLAELLRAFSQVIFHTKVEHSDELDAFFKNIATTGGRGSGEFYTPPEIAELMANLMEPQGGEDICDPACGTGSLLIRCAQQLRQYEEHPSLGLYGQEKNASTWALAKMNLVLHGELNHNIEQGDTLRDPRLLDGESKLKLFDIVIANPPYNISDWGFEQAEQDTFHRFDRGVPPRSRADFAFILHMVTCMKPQTGRMAVMVPHGVLFRHGAEEDIRQRLVADNLIDAVIGLPPKLLFHATIPMVILVLRQHKVDDHVLFIDASRAFKPGKVYNSLRSEDIQVIVKTCKERKSIEGMAYLASKMEIEAKRCNLNISLYVKRKEEAVPFDLEAVRAERAQLIDEMRTLETQLASCLRECSDA